MACSDENPAPIYPLTQQNLAGTYNIQSMRADLNATAVVQGATVPVSSGNVVGDTFQVSFIINTDGTYTASGQYRITTTVTPIGSAPVTNTEIVVFNDSGTYTLNTSNNTITMTSSNSDFFEGTLQIQTFNETSFSLSQEITEVNGGVTGTAAYTIVFVRI